MTDPRWATRQEARANGWHSRRHKTSEPHTAAVVAWREKHGPAARKRRADERTGAS